MNIGDAAGQSRLPAKTIRYYEEIGLITPSRRDNGYRDYSNADVDRLRFLQRSRSLGFAVEDCRQLLGLYEDENRASSDVKALAQSHLREIDDKLKELRRLKQTLQQLVDSCKGDDHADCPIIEKLAGEAPS